jgi:hypothetical protein
MLEASAGLSVDSLPESFLILYGARCPSEHTANFDCINLQTSTYLILPAGYIRPTQQAARGRHVATAVLLTAETFQMSFNHFPGKFEIEHRNNFEYL